MSTPIDSNELDMHSRYAVDTTAFELFKGQYHISDFTNTRAISDHAMVLDYVPKPGAFVQLFPVDAKRRCAYFEMPSHFGDKRLYFFNKDPIEKDEADLQKIHSIQTSKQHTHEKAVLEKFCKLKIDLKEDYNYIIGRIHHFVQV